MAPFARRIPIALALALAGVGVASQAPVPGDAVATAAVQRGDGAPAAREDVAPSSGTQELAPARSLSTQRAIVEKFAHRGRFRRGKQRGAWVPTKVGGRLVYWHKQ